MEDNPTNEARILTSFLFSSFFFTSSIFSGPSPNCSRSTGSSQMQRSVREKREFEKKFKDLSTKQWFPPAGGHEAHRGHYVNAVLPVVQEGEYIAQGIGHTHCAVGQQLEPRTSVCRGNGSLQREGSKVEKQSQEMVKNILRSRKGRDMKHTAGVYVVFLCVCFIFNINRFAAGTQAQQKGQTAWPLTRGPL